eukprot:PITA_16686
MALVTSNIFSILLNGAPSRTFTPSRGLREGDPLSLFLFILMMEGLGRVIKMENVEGRIQGIKLTMDGEANTHQQFVNDTMLQGIPKVREARAIKSILNEFAMVASIDRAQLSSKYLGIPLTHKQLSKKVWEPILNKLYDKIRKWTCRSLNLAWNLVLTHEVFQVIPIFKFSALLAPQGIKKQIRSIQMDFMWGRGEEKNQWAFVAWEKICKCKLHGGLRLHDHETLSRVLEAMLWWRWTNEPNVTWAQLLKQKYAKH